MQAHVLPTFVQMPVVHLRWRPFALPTSQPSRTTISCCCSGCLLPLTMACSLFRLAGRAACLIVGQPTLHRQLQSHVDGRPAYLMSDVATCPACISCCTPPDHLSTPLLHISRACKPRTRCQAHLSLVPAHTPGTLCWLQVAEPFCCSLAGISEWVRFPGCLASRKRRSTCRRRTEPGRRARHMAAEEGHTAQEGPQCQVCSQAAAKYCCPRCDKRTCSLECVKGAPPPPLAPRSSLRTTALNLQHACLSAGLVHTCCPLVSTQPPVTPPPACSAQGRLGLLW